MELAVYVTFGLSFGFGCWRDFLPGVLRPEQLPSPDSPSDSLAALSLHQGELPLPPLSPQCQPFWVVELA